MTISELRAALEVATHVSEGFHKEACGNASLTGMWKSAEEHRKVLQKELDERSR